MVKLFAVKPLSLLSKEAGEEGEHTLRRSLGPVNLITLGIGATVAVYSILYDAVLHPWPYAGSTGSPMSGSPIAPVEMIRGG